MLPGKAMPDADKYLPVILAKRGIGSSDIDNGWTAVRELVYEILTIGLSGCSSCGCVIEATLS